MSGEIDFDKLNYTEKFTSYLKLKIGSFDRYISRLENYCSLLFSITFLLVFYVIGFMAINTVVGLLTSLIRYIEFIPDDISSYITKVIVVLFGLSSLIVFVDFLGQGFLKKKKWTTKIYFPIYWLFSKLTLSFLYRPIAYNFLDNKLGKRVSLFLFPVYVVIFFIGEFGYYNSNYINILKGSSQNFADNLNYDDEITKETQFVDFASIPSKTIHTSYLKVFIPFSTAKEDFVYKVNKSLKPENDIRAYGTGVMVGCNDASQNEDKETKNKNLTDYLDAINQLYCLKIDSNQHNSDFILAKNAKQRIGFETYLDIRNLSNGKHLLTINGPQREKTSTKEETIIFNKKLITIPFWYFPQNNSMPIKEETTNIQTIPSK